MTVNPYQATSVADAKEASHATPTRKTQGWPLWHLSVACVLTLLFATFNAWQEEHQGRGLVFLAGLSIVSQLPGLAVAQWFRLSSKSHVGVMLVAAYFVAATGLLVFGVYAFNGKADSMNSAAHMHVVAFPVFHIALALFVYCCAGFGSFCIYVYRR